MTPTATITQDDRRGVADSPSAAPRTVDDLLAAARRSLSRVLPHLAAQGVAAGALIIDIRPEAQRRTEGGLVGALVIERNVLEWRLDPSSRDRIPEITGHDQVIIVACSAGYASSFAAASLQQLGFTSATDLVGGFQAWKAAGLPTTRGVAQVER